MHVWRLIAHHEDAPAAIAWTQRSNRIAIGWGLIGDLTSPGFHGPDDITASIRGAYPTLNNAHNGGRSLWNLLSMNVGDLVIVRGKGAPAIVVEVCGPYQFNAPPPNLSGGYNHQREIDLTQIDARELWRQHPMMPGQSPYATLVRCQ